MPKKRPQAVMGAKGRGNDPRQKLRSLFPRSKITLTPGTLLQEFIEGGHARHSRRQYLNRKFGRTSKTGDLQNPTEKHEVREYAWNRKRPEQNLELPIGGTGGRVTHKTGGIYVHSPQDPNSSTHHEESELKRGHGVSAYDLSFMPKKYHSDPDPQYQDPVLPGKGGVQRARRLQAIGLTIAAERPGGKAGGVHESYLGPRSRRKLWSSTKRLNERNEAARKSGKSLTPWHPPRAPRTPPRGPPTMTLPGRDAFTPPDDKGDEWKKGHPEHEVPHFLPESVPEPAHWTPGDRHYRNSEFASLQGPFMGPTSQLPNRRRGENVYIGIGSQPRGVLRPQPKYANSTSKGGERIGSQMVSPRQGATHVRVGGIGEDVNASQIPGRPFLPYPMVDAGVSKRSVPGRKAQADKLEQIGHLTPYRQPEPVKQWGGTDVDWSKLGPRSRWKIQQSIARQKKQDEGGKGHDWTPPSPPKVQGRRDEHGNRLKRTYEHSEFADEESGPRKVFDVKGKLRTLGGKVAKTGDEKMGSFVNKPHTLEPTKAQAKQQDENRVRQQQIKAGMAYTDEEMVANKRAEDEAKKVAKKKAEGEQLGFDFSSYMFSDGLVSQLMNEFGDGLFGPSGDPWSSPAWHREQQRKGRQSVPRGQRAKVFGKPTAPRKWNRPPNKGLPGIKQGVRKKFEYPKGSGIPTGGKSGTVFTPGRMTQEQRVKGREKARVRREAKAAIAKPVVAAKPAVAKPVAAKPAAVPAAVPAVQPKSIPGRGPSAAWSKSRGFPTPNSAGSKVQNTPGSRVKIPSISSPSIPTPTSNMPPSPSRQGRRVNPAIPSSKLHEFATPLEKTVEDLRNQHKKLRKAHRRLHKSHSQLSKDLTEAEENKGKGTPQWLMPSGPVGKAAAWASNAAGAVRGLVGGGRKHRAGEPVPAHSEFQAGMDWFPDEAKMKAKEDEARRYHPLSQFGEEHEQLYRSVPHIIDSLKGEHPAEIRRQIKIHQITNILNSGSHTDPKQIAHLKQNLSFHKSLGRQTGTEHGTSEFGDIVGHGALRDPNTAKALIKKVSDLSDARMQAPNYGKYMDLSAELHAARQELKRVGEFINKPIQKSEFYAPTIKLRSFRPGHLESDGRKRGGVGRKMMTPGNFKFVEGRKRKPPGWYEAQEEARAVEGRKNWPEPTRPHHMVPGPSGTGIVHGMPETVRRTDRSGQHVIQTRNVSPASIHPGQRLWNIVKAGSGEGTLKEGRATRKGVRLTGGRKGPLRPGWNTPEGEIQSSEFGDHEFISGSLDRRLSPKQRARYEEAKKHIAETQYRGGLTQHVGLRPKRGKLDPQTGKYRLKPEEKSAHNIRRGRHPFDPQLAGGRLPPQQLNSEFGDQHFVAPLVVAGLWAGARAAAPHVARWIGGRAIPWIGKQFVKRGVKKYAKRRAAAKLTTQLTKNKAYSRMAGLGSRKAVGQKITETVNKRAAGTGFKNWLKGGDTRGAATPMGSRIKTWAGRAALTGLGVREGLRTVSESVSPSRPGPGGGGGGSTGRRVNPFTRGRSSIPGVAR